MQTNNKVWSIGTEKKPTTQGMGEQKKGAARRIFLRPPWTTSQDISQRQTTPEHRIHQTASDHTWPPQSHLQVQEHHTPRLPDTFAGTNRHIWMGPHGHFQHSNIFLWPLGDVTKIAVDTYCSQGRPTTPPTSRLTATPKRSQQRKFKTTAPSRAEPTCPDGCGMPTAMLQRKKSGARRLMTRGSLA